MYQTMTSNFFMTPTVLDNFVPRTVPDASDTQVNMMCDTVPILKEIYLSRPPK